MARVSDPDQETRHRVHQKRTATLKTVDKALFLLEFLGNFGGQVGVRELADYLKLNKSSVHRLLTTLQSHGYVAQDPHTGKYQLGMRVFQVGAVVLGHTNLRAAARPHLERLAELTGEVVHLAVENGGQCLYVDKVSGAQAIQMGSALGWRRPLYCTGVGKVLLAYLPEQRSKEIICGSGLHPYTPNTITDPEVLAAELTQIRATGIAYDREEMEMGLRCVAGPVVGVDGAVVAAVSVAGPSSRFTGERLSNLTELVCSAAAAISRDLLLTGMGSERSNVASRVAREQGTRAAPNGPESRCEE